MLLPHANPVVSAHVISDEALIANFEECRQIHKNIQAGECGEDEKKWSPNVVYLMLVGDCMAREMMRRELKAETNLILQHHQNPFPDFWKNIIVPEFMFDIQSQNDDGWDSDKYPEKSEEEDKSEEETEESSDE